MRVGILGTGVVGQAIGTGFVTLGHEVKLGSRAEHNEAGVAFAAKHPELGSAGTFADTAAFGELLVVATKGLVLPEVIAAAGAGSFSGKVVIDTTNPLDFSKGYPDLGIKGEDSAGETLQRLIPDAKVVKAFNIVTANLMFRPNIAGGPPDMLIAGNDADAKATVTGILGEFGWPAIDCGGILSARWLEAVCMAWVMASMARKNWNQAFKLLQG